MGGLPVELCECAGGGVVHGVAMGDVPSHPAPLGVHRDEEQVRFGVELTGGKLVSVDPKLTIVDPFAAEFV
jgi:hypothetical protein